MIESGVHVTSVKTPAGSELQHAHLRRVHAKPMCGKIGVWNRSHYKDVLINLHVSKDEQRVRLQSRVDDPTKRWKFRTGDLEDRKLWPQLMKADEVAFSETSTENAPWFVVPADRKWVRDLCVARIVHDALVTMNPVLPPDDPTVAGTVVV